MLILCAFLNLWLDLSPVHRRIFPMPWTQLRLQINWASTPSVIVTGTSRPPALPAETGSTRGWTGSPISWKIRNELVYSLQICVCLLLCEWVGVCVFCVCVWESETHTATVLTQTLTELSIPCPPPHSFRFGHCWFRLCLCVCVCA